jgi:hypothetical protein
LNLRETNSLEFEKAPVPGAGTAKEKILKTPVAEKRPMRPPTQALGLKNYDPRVKRISDGQGKETVSTTKDRLLEVCGKERVELAGDHRQKRKHRLLDALTRRQENPGVFLEQTQETVIIFFGKMFPYQ